MKPRYKLDKRQKEIARKQKQDRKKEEKLLRKDQPDDTPGHALAAFADTSGDAVAGASAGTAGDAAGGDEESPTPSGEENSSGN